MQQWDFSAGPPAPHRRASRPAVRAASGDRAGPSHRGGHGVVRRYRQTPGYTGTAPTTWPGGDAVSRNSGKPDVVLPTAPRLHRLGEATLEQLQRLRASRPSAFHVAPGYDGPAGADVIGPLLARHLGHPARRPSRFSRFGFLTSGHAVLYDEAGRLRLRRGLTRSARRGRLPRPARLPPLFAVVI